MGVLREIGLDGFFVGSLIFLLPASLYCRNANPGGVGISFRAGRAIDILGLDPIMHKQGTMVPTISSQTQKLLRLLS